MPGDASAVDPRVTRFIAREVPRNVGANTAWGIYNRGIRTPLNVALDLAAERLGRDPVLVWVDGGVPDAFSWPGLPAPVVVWSTRHLEIASTLRNLTQDHMFGGMRKEFARRTTLAVVAELCLRLGKPQYAARCFLLSAWGQDFFFPHADILDDLEAAPFSEAYSALWCFALAHELGHYLPDHGMPDDATLVAEVKQSLEQIAVVSAHPDLLDSALAELRADRNHSNAPSRLRAEVTADLFAAETIVHVAYTLMGSDGRTPAGGQLYAEILMAHTGISFIEWCRALASGLGQVTDRQAVVRRLHATAGAGVRNMFTRWYAEKAIGGVMPQGTDLRRWAAALDQLVEALSANASVIDSGVADAMRQVLAPPLDDNALLAEVRAECRQATHRSLLAAHAQTFRALATASQAGDRASTPDGASDPLLDAVVALLS